MRAIAITGWLGIVGAFLVWQGIGLVRGPEWPTMSDFFRSLMAIPLGRFVVFGRGLGWAGTCSSVLGTEIEAIGGRRLPMADFDEYGFQWRQMADPEGNEFCLFFAGL